MRDGDGLRLLLPYGDTLQLKVGDVWESKFVVVSPYKEDPSRIFVAMFDGENLWTEGGIGRETLLSSNAIVEEITEFSSTRYAGKDEDTFVGRTRGFMLAVSKTFDPDDVTTLLFNALDNDQRAYWKRMFERCIVRIKASLKRSKDSQKDYSGWIPSLTKRSLRLAETDPLGRQYQILQRDGRWMNDDEAFGNVRLLLEKRDNNGGGFHQVPKDLRCFYFHVEAGTRKILRLRRSTYAFVRFALHLLLLICVVSLMSETVLGANRRYEFSKSTTDSLMSPQYYDSDDLRYVSLSSVIDVDGFYGWLETTALSHTFGPDVEYSDRNIPLGSIRVRQVRRGIKTSCDNANASGADLTCFENSDFEYSTSLACDPATAAASYGVSNASSLCSPAGSSLFAWSSSSETAALPKYEHPPGVDGQEEMYVTIPFSGYVVDLDSSNRTFAIAQIQAMRDSSFIAAPHTAMVYVSTSIYNSGLDFLGKVEARFELSLAGEMIGRVTATPTLGRCTTTFRALYYVLIMSACVNLALLLYYDARTAAVGVAGTLGISGDVVPGSKNERDEVVDGDDDRNDDDGGGGDAKEHCAPFFFLVELLTLVTIIVGTVLIYNDCSYASELVDAAVRYAPRVYVDLSSHIFISYFTTFLLCVATFLMFVIILRHGRRHGRVIFFARVLSGLQSSFFGFVFFGFLAIFVLVMCAPLISGGYVYAFKDYSSTFRNIWHTLLRVSTDSTQTRSFHAYTYFYNVPTLAITFLVEVCRALFTFVLISALLLAVARVRDALRMQSLANIRDWSRWENARSITVPLVRQWIEYFQMAVILPAFYRHIVEAITTNDAIRDKMYLSYDELYRIVRDELEYNRHCCGVRCCFGRCNVFTAFFDIDEAAHGIVQSLIAMQPANMHCLPTVLRYWAVERGDRRRRRRRRLAFASKGTATKSEDEGARDGDDDDDDDAPLDRWSNAAAMDFGDVTSKQQIRSMWNERILRGELMHASAYAMRHRNDARLRSLNRGICDVQRSLRVVGDLVQNLHRGVSRLSTVSIDVEDDAHAAFAEEEMEEEDATTSSSTAATAAIDVADVKRDSAREDADEADTRATVSSKSAASIFKSGAKRAKRFALARGGGVDAPSSADKFKASARVIRAFQDELNSTIVELQADRRAASDTHDGEGDDGSSNMESDNGSQESSKWGDFKFETDFLKKWSALDRTDPVDRSWDKIRTKFRRVGGGAGGADDARPSNDRRDDESAAKPVSTGFLSRVLGVVRGRDDETFSSSLGVEDVTEDKDLNEEDAETNELPDLWSVDRIDAEWDLKDEEWRNYVAQNRPEALKGRRVEIRWEEGYQAGTITQYNPHSRQHTVEYDDGELRRYNLGRKKYRFIQ